MPIGPNGEKRPRVPNEAAVMACKIATGRSEEEYVDGEPSTENRDEQPRSFMLNVSRSKDRTEQSDQE